MTEEDIVAVLLAYRVHKHYRASTAAKGTRYAVFRGRDQVSEPMAHDAAQQACARMVARDILGL